MKLKQAFIAPRRVSLAQEKLLSTEASDEDFFKYARACISGPCSAVLLSGGKPLREQESRYSMAAWDPYAVLKAKGNRCTVNMCEHTSNIDADPLELLDEISACFEPDFPLLTHPFSGGAIGYFAYDLKNAIERLPQTAFDDLLLPDLLFFWPRKIIIHDRIQGRLSLLTLSFRDEKQVDGNEGQGGFCRKPSSEPWPNTREEPASLFQVGDLQSNFSHGAYLEAVEAVRRYIGKGDVYQVNLSQRYQFSFEGDPFCLWKSLFDINPAPFYAYIHAEDHQVFSTSMERFLYRKGQYIETRPIKGTRKRGKTQEEDELLKRDLQKSAKDDAELSMIVDLLRNDLGRVCTGRTIRVREHKRLETYQNVHHLVSIVTGELRPDITYGDLIRATFPGGSITGCPKIRAMQIIDELEPSVRHVYTGAIGYLGWHENLDLNIAIRTGIIQKGTCYFSVGGGIVYDSKEEEEYQETLHKGRTLFQLIDKIGKKTT